MSSGLNKVLLIGYTGNKPVVSENNYDTVKFSLATHEGYYDKQRDERVNKTTWHKVISFNKNINAILLKYVEKGSYLLVEGKIETNEWVDDQGVKKYITQIVLGPFNSNVVLLGEKQGVNPVSSPQLVDDDIPF